MKRVKGEKGRKGEKKKKITQQTNKSRKKCGWALLYNNNVFLKDVITTLPSSSRKISQWFLNWVTQHVIWYYPFRQTGICDSSNQNKTTLYDTICPWYNSSLPFISFHFPCSNFMKAEVCFSSLQHDKMKILHMLL